MAIWNVLERANLLLEGYFLALYVPLGGSTTQMENITSKSIKFYISMFSDKPPCIPFCFGIVERRCNNTGRGGLGFFFFHIFFLSLYNMGFFHIFFLSLYSRGFLHIFFISSFSTFSSSLAFFFHFLFFLRFFFHFFFFLRLSF